MRLGALSVEKNLSCCDSRLFAADTVASGLSCLELTWILGPYNFSTQNSFVSDTDLISCLFMLTIKEKKVPPNLLAWIPSSYLWEWSAKKSEGSAFLEPWNQL